MAVGADVRETVELISSSIIIHWISWCDYHGRIGGEFDIHCLREVGRVL